MVCIFSFAGCGNVNVPSVNIFEENSFRITRQADSSGKIALSYIFPVNSKALKEENFTEGEIKTYRFYLSTYVNALAGQNRDKEISGVTISNCTYFTDVDGLGFSIIFDDLSAQKKFFGMTEDEEEKGADTKTSGLFMKRVEMSTSFPISSKKSANDLQLICSMAITSWCKDNNISDEKRNKAIKVLEESIYVYDFATTQKALKSEIMFDDENFHHNVFIKNYDELDDNTQIVFYTTYPNTPVWYATALIVVLCGMTIAYFTIKDKKVEEKNGEKKKIFFKKSK